MRTDRTTPLHILLAGPRGFCAGVDRAVLIVQRAIEKYGPPVYVRHEIVHNRYVVESLQAIGAVFVDDLDQCPDDRPVIFSAHGVPKSVPKQARKRRMIYVDATCPLVSKVHREVERHHRNGCHTILVGHAGHPEVVGTMGQLPHGAITLVETVEDVGQLRFTAHQALAYATQTTLSVAETASILEALKQRFPSVQGPKQEDICYATTNRQNAVKAIAAQSDMLLVIGAPNSSNSRRLVDVAQAHGCPRTALIQRAHDIRWEDFNTVSTLGLTAGASAPEDLVTEVIQACREQFSAVHVREVTTTVENVLFKPPRELLP